MYKLTITKNQFSPVFHLAHSIKKICKTNSALALTKAEVVIKKGMCDITLGSYFEINCYKSALEEKGIKAEIKSIK